MNMHTDEKPSKYKYCGKFCMKQCNLVLHSKTHTSGKLFRCNQWGKDDSILERMACQYNLAFKESYDGKSIQIDRFQVDF